MRSLLEHVDLKVAIVPQTATNDDTAIVGEIIDRRNFEALLFAIILGTLTDANATFAVTMEHGDAANLSDTEAVAAADLDGATASATALANAAFTFAADKLCRKIGYVGNKRYVRLTITPTGNNSGAAPVSAVAILGNPKVRPTPQPPV